MPTTRGQARAANGGAPAVTPKAKTTPKKAAARKPSPKDVQKNEETKVEEKRKPEAENGENGEEVEQNNKPAKLAKTKEGQDVKQAEKANGESKIEANKKKVEEEEKKTEEKGEEQKGEEQKVEQNGEQKDEPKEEKKEEQNVETKEAQAEEKHESRIDANKKNVEEEEQKEVEMTDADKESHQQQQGEVKIANPVQLNAGSEPQQQKPTPEAQTSVKEDHDVKYEDATPAIDPPKSDIKINPETEQPETLHGTPNPVIEKGTFYWFFRNKIDVEEAESLTDVQRAYLVLRPIPHGQQPGNDNVKNEDINRVLIFPKKKFPSIGSHEREISFIDVANCSVSKIRDTVLASRTYSTKTKGDRTLDAARPVAEGVYSILHGTNDRSSHFAYILTTPTDLTNVTTDFGLHERGSFVISVRNPEFPPPAGAGVPIGSNVTFPKELQEKFNGLRWMAVDRSVLDVQGAQLLWIGESGNVHVAGEDGKQQEAAKDDLEGLEEEDKERVEGLKSDDPVFDDLSLSAKNFDGLKVSWEE